jgi:hypothetical protein
MADRIGREIHARAFETEDRKPDRRYSKDDTVCYQQVLARPPTGEIKDELNKSEDANDKSKQDHRWHEEEAEQVSDAR